RSGGDIIPNDVGIPLIAPVRNVGLLRRKRWRKVRDNVCVGINQSQVLPSVVQLKIRVQASGGVGPVLVRSEDNQVTAAWNRNSARDAPFCEIGPVIGEKPTSEI